MEPVPEIDLAGLVKEARSSIIGEKIREAKKQIRHVMQGLDKTGKEITELKKEIEKKEKTMTRGRDKIQRISRGAWHLLSD